VLVEVLVELLWGGDVLADVPWPAGVHAETIAAARAASSSSDLRVMTAIAPYGRIRVVFP